MRNAARKLARQMLAVSISADVGSVNIKNAHTGAVPQGREDGSVLEWDNLVAGAAPLAPYGAPRQRRMADPSRAAAASVRRIVASTGAPPRDGLAIV